MCQSSACACVSERQSRDRAVQSSAERECVLEQCRESVCQSSAELSRVEQRAEQRSTESVSEQCRAERVCVRAEQRQRAERDSVCVCE